MAIDRFAGSIGSGRFLHIVPDDKFIDLAREAFEFVAPGRNEFIHLARPGTHRYLRGGTVRGMSLAEALSPAFLGALPDYDRVFVHYLDDRARLLVSRAPEATRMLWIGWGADYYHLISAPDALMLPETRALVSEVSGPGPDRAARRALALQVPQQVPAHDEPASVLRIRVRREGIGPRGPNEPGLLNRFDWFAPVLPQEHAAVAQACAGFRPALARWNYPLHALGGSLPGPAGTAGDAILVGNSAAPGNNHVETFRQVALGWDGRRPVVCPMSYGGDAFADRVEQEGRRLFGGRFVALREFLGFQAYLEVLRGCSMAAMGHLRQQGLGNILLMACLGARVYLRSQNPIYPYLLGQGLPVRELGRWPSEANEPAPGRDEIEASRRLVEALFGTETNIRATRDLLLLR